MKKTLLALAVLGSSAGAALAQSAAPEQSKVNIVYGLLDLGIVQESGGPSGSILKLSSGIANGSRVGFKGNAGLGDGLTALYQVEAGFQADTGVSGQGGVLFGRQAFVGLGGDFGTVTAGRQYTTIDNLISKVDPFENGYAGRAQNVFMQAYVSRVNNNVMYSTPKNMGGLTGELAYGFGEVAGSTAKSNYIGASVGYDNGPLLVRLAYQKSNDATATNSDRNTILGAMYNFGPVKLHAALAVNNKGVAGVTKVDAQDVMIGVTLPFGRHSFMAGYVRRNDRLAVNRDADQIGIGYNYNRSANWTFYTAYGKISNKNGAAYTVGYSTEAGTGDKGFDLGVRFRF